MRHGSLNQNAGEGRAGVSIGAFPAPIGLYIQRFGDQSDRPSAKKAETHLTALEHLTQSKTTLRLCLFMEGQVANYALPTTEPSASAARGSLSTGRFRNWKLMAIELAVALLGFYVFIVTTTGNLAAPGIVGVIAGIGALWLFQRELLGISIDSQTLTMPTRQIPWMPAFSFRRRTVLLREVRRLTMSARWLGFEVVKISGDFGSDRLVFASRDQRRRFTALIQSICPGVAVYRSRSYRIRTQSDPSVPLPPCTLLGDRTALGLIPDRQGPEDPEKASARGLEREASARSSMRPSCSSVGSIRAIQRM